MAWESVTVLAVDILSPMVWVIEAVEDYRQESCPVSMNIVWAGKQI